MKQPIFFAWTRSFWLGIFPALMVAFDVTAAVIMDPETIPPIAGFIAWIFDANPYQVENWLVRIAPLFALIIAHQRRGENRPYTARLSRDTLT